MKINCCQFKFWLDLSLLNRYETCLLPKNPGHLPFSVVATAGMVILYSDIDTNIFEETRFFALFFIYCCFLVPIKISDNKDYYKLRSYRASPEKI